MGESKQKPMKNFGNSSRGHSQGVRKIFRAPIHGAHCEVIFAIVQLSCLFCCSRVFLFPFSAPTINSLRLISEVARSIVTKFWQMFDDSRIIYKIESEIWAPPEKFGDPKTSKFETNFGQLCNLIANISDRSFERRLRAVEDAVAVVDTTIHDISAWTKSCILSILYSARGTVGPLLSSGLMCCGNVSSVSMVTYTYRHVIDSIGHCTQRWCPFKRAITSEIKHAINLKQVLKNLHNCCSSH